MVYRSGPRWRLSTQRFAKLISLLYIFLASFHLQSVVSLRALKGQHIDRPVISLITDHVEPSMHPLNPYLEKRPDFASLAAKYPSFAPYVSVSESGHASIDFQDSKALRALTSVLLKEDWGYDVELREDRLCPTIANRLDYLYHVLDIEPYLQPITGVLAPSASGSKPQRRRLRVLDIGTGHIAIYPLLLHHLRPTAQTIATELDAVSFHHSLKTRLANKIPSSSISIQRPTPDQKILFPIFDSLTQSKHGEAGGDKWDFVICNPPFFGSEDEMREGREGKLKGAPAAPTAAENELITPGGEVQFVGQMITESLELKESCQWYTSLIGKYSSLMALVDQLKRDKIDNYFILSIRQSRTTRWILGWSFTSVRLPDSITRPEALTPGTSFVKLLPHPNTFTHTPRPPLPLSELRQKIEAVLKEVQLLPSDKESVSSSNEPTKSKPSGEDHIVIAPTKNTWSRAARRQAARAQAEPTPAEPASEKMDVTPLFRAELHFVEIQHRWPKASTGTVGPEGGEVDGEVVPLEKEEEKTAVNPYLQTLEVKDGEKEKSAKGVHSDAEELGTRVELRWLEGKDRIVVEGLWKYILTKAGLVGGK